MRWHSRGPSQTNRASCGVVNHLIPTIWSPFLPWSLQASHLRDFGTDAALPLARVGLLDAAVAADAELTVLAQISTVEDEAQGLQAASALSLPQLLGPTRTFPFDLQQLVLQLPVGQEEEEGEHWGVITGAQREMTWLSSAGSHRILFSSRFLSFSSFCSTFRIISLSCSSRKERFRSSPFCSIGSSIDAGPVNSATSCCESLRFQQRSVNYPAFILALAQASTSIHRCSL